MTMTLEQVRNALRNPDFSRFVASPSQKKCNQWADAIDAYLTQPAQACEHDWAVGYGVPAYCNHCGIERDPKPAQSVDIEAIREVIVWLRSGSMAITANAGIAADKLEAALPESKP